MKPKNFACLLVDGVFSTNYVTSRAWAGACKLGTLDGAWWRHTDPRKTINHHFLLFTLVLLFLATCRQAEVRESSRKRNVTEQVRGSKHIPRVERGRYLVNHVAQCFDCHSPLDDSDDPQPLPNMLGSGDILNEETTLVAPNITPDADTGAGKWTDEQLSRAIREGVGHDGRRLSHQMPWHHYSVLTDEDVQAIIVYLRSLSPVSRRLPRNGAPPETDVIAPVRPARDSDLNTPVARGAYLVRIARCVYCHTPLGPEGVTDLELAFGGGRRFVHRKNWYVDVDPDPQLKSKSQKDVVDLDDVVSSINLTRDPSGLAHYDTQVFIRTMRTGKVNGIRPLSTAMPWAFFRGMTDADLSAIFAYLRQLPPLKHNVSNTETPTYCKVCRRRHGSGEWNAFPQ